MSFDRPCCQDIGYFIFSLTTKFSLFVFTKLLDDLKNIQILNKIQASLKLQFWENIVSLTGQDLQRNSHDILSSREGS